MDTLSQFLPMLKYQQTIIIIKSDQGSFSVDLNHEGKYDVFNFENKRCTLNDFGSIKQIMLYHHDSDENSILYNTN